MKPKCDKLHFQTKARKIWQGLYTKTAWFVLPVTVYMFRISISIYCLYILSIIDTQAVIQIYTDTRGGVGGGGRCGSGSGLGLWRTVPAVHRFYRFSAFFSIFVSFLAPLDFYTVLRILFWRMVVKKCCRAR